MFEIRPVTEADFPSVVDVVRSVFLEYGFAWDDGPYYADLYDPISHYPAPGGFWVCVIDGAVVGTVGLEVFESVPIIRADQPAHPIIHEGKTRVAGADCSLERLYLRADFRGQGVGRALFQTTIEAARSLSLKRMEIWSDKLLEPAHALYHRVGAVIVADRLCDDPDESPEWGLSLDL